MISVRTSTGVKAAAAFRVRDAVGQKVAANVRVRDAANVLQLAYSSAAGGAFSVNPAPLAAFGARAGGGNTITSEEVVATVTGGQAPYSYQWAFVSSTGGTWTIESPNADRTRFVCAGVSAGIDRTASFTCTVTDNRGIAVTSTAVEVTCENYGDLGGILP